MVQKGQLVQNAATHMLNGASLIDCTTHILQEYCLQCKVLVVTRVPEGPSSLLGSCTAIKIWARPSLGSVIGRNWANGDQEENPRNYGFGICPQGWPHGSIIMPL